MTQTELIWGEDVEIMTHTSRKRSGRTTDLLPSTQTHYHEKDVQSVTNRNDEILIEIQVVMQQYSFSWPH